MNTKLANPNVNKNNYLFDFISSLSFFTNCYIIIKDKYGEEV